MAATVVSKSFGQTSSASVTQQQINEPIHVTLFDLVVGDEIIAYMRLGLALRTKRRVDGTVYRTVPSRLETAISSDLTRFRGTVTANDVDQKILSVNTVRVDSWRVPTANNPVLHAQISYGALKTVHLLSDFHFVPRDENRRGAAQFRPTTKAIGTNFKAYRTIENIIIP